MSARDLANEKLTQAEAQTSDLARLLKVQPKKRPSSTTLPAVIIGELLAIADNGKSPLVIYPGQPGVTALKARTVLDLHSTHIGQAVVLSFENGDPALPIVTGVLRQIHSQPLDAPGNVEVDADGQRMVVSAKEQIVLRCGKSSITLTKSGHVEIRGEVIVSQAVSANRIRGGSVEMN